jgi:hypothetical protein
VVAFQPKGRRGAFLWEAGLKTDLPGEPSVVIPLKAFVLREAMLSDDIVNFGVFKRGQKKQNTIWLVCQEHPQFKLKDVQASVTGYTVQFQETTVSGFYPGDQRGYQVEIRPMDDIEYGRKHGYLYLLTDIPGHEKMELRLFGYVIGDITAAPDYMAFGVVKSGAVVQKNIKVSHNDYQKFEILRITSSLPFVSGQLRTIIPKKYYEIDVTLTYPENPVVGEFRGKLEIQTDCPTHAIVGVELQGVILTNAEKKEKEEEKKKEKEK